MSTMRRWIVGEPITAFILAAGFGSLATSMGLRPDWIPYLLAVFCVGLLVMTISMWKYTVPIILAIVLAVPVIESKAQAPFPERDGEIQPAGLGVAAGVVVVCVGAYCVYKTAKFCSKKFPPKDSGSNSLSAFAASGGQSGDEYGAAWNYGPLGSCWDGNYEFAPTAEDEDGTLFRLNIIVDSPYSLSQSMTATTGGGQGFQTFLEFQAEMLSHGLWISGQADGSQSFSWNRQPIDPSMSPISFDPITKTVRNSRDGEMRRIVVHRSNNLQNWEHFLSTEVGIGAGIQVVDATRQGQMFYRVTLSPCE